MMIQTYEKFSMINNEIITYIDELSKSDLKVEKSKEIEDKLQELLTRLETVKESSDNINIEENNADKINNLRYSVMNSLFLLSDLLHFYKLGEIERFKMRAVNYINHVSRPQFY